MSRYRLVGVGMVGAAVLALAVAIYVLSVAPAPLSTVKTFVASLETNDFEAAYSIYHADLRQRQSFPEFVEAWKGRSSSLSKANRSWSTDVENDTAEVKGRFSTAGGVDWSAVFRLINQDELWQIIDYEVMDGLSDFGPGA
ncbi:MAG: hypothetical protein IIC93_04790 [Chloroflexi bacterium]|nr:hypothetical protein [Chloroflexota bacterium]